MRVLWQLPVFLTPLRSDEPRTPSWNELFFDIIFVGALTRIGHIPDVYFDSLGYWNYVALAFPAYWCWYQGTTYFTMFDQQDIPHTALYYLSMFGAMGLSANIIHCIESDVFVESCTHFLLFFISIRLFQGLMWSYALFFDVRTRKYTACQVVNNVLVTLFWFVCVFTSNRIVFLICWCAGIVVDLAFFVITLYIERKINLGVDTDYIIQRFDSLVLVSLAAPLCTMKWDPDLFNFTPEIYGNAFLALTIAYQFKLLYFELESTVGSGAHGLDRGFFLKMSWILLHFPLLLCIISQSVVFLHILATTRLQENFKWSMSIACAGFLLTLVALSLTHKGTGLKKLGKRTRIACSVIAAICVSILPLVAKNLRSVFFILIIAGIFQILLFVEFIGKRPNVQRVNFGRADGMSTSDSERSFLGINGDYDD